MCGIIAYLGCKPGIRKAYEGLLILKNRGYDSAGMSSIVKSGGKSGLKNKILIHKYATTPENSAFDLLVPHLPSHDDAVNSILHSRWSVVGVPTSNNSHPHIDYTNTFSLVHNGIIENYASLKKELLDLDVDVEFKSDTDTEVIVNIIGYYYSQCGDIRKSIDMAINKLEGTWGLVIQNVHEPDKLYCARHGSPLLIGLESDFVIISSEQTGFAKYVEKYISLNNNDIIELERENNKIKFSKIDEYIIRESKIENFSLTPDPYPHWTLKEIHEQYESSIRAIGSRIMNKTNVKLGGLDSHASELINIDNLIILGCGTSYHAGLYTSDLFRIIGGFNTVQVIDGGEFHKYYIPKKGITGLILLSQSGETKDLHRCVELAKNKNIIMMGVINVVDSMIARETRCGVYLNAGREIGVASTKCFTSQVIVLNMIACWFSQNKYTNKKYRKDILKGLKSLPLDIESVISNTKDQCMNFAQYLKNYQSLFILGKGRNHAIAMEGALKIRELGYINSNGYSTSSLKHGSYALLEKGSPVIVLLPDDEMFSRNNSVIDELKSRGSYVVVITDKDLINSKFDICIKIPTNPLFYGVLANISIQLIAYYVALLRGNTIDCPRNLAKTVTTD